MSKQELKPLIIIGGGGHASVLVDILRAQKRNILAVICPDDISVRRVFSGIPHYKSDEDVLNFSTEDVLLVNGIGMLPRSCLKRNVNERFEALGFEFETVIASSAEISEFAQLENGSQVFAGAIVQAGVKIGRHSVVNTGAIIEHDCDIGEHNHIAPSAILCGQVTTGDNVYIGAGATVIQNLNLGRGCIVGAGATILKNVEKNVLVYSSLNQKQNLDNNES